MEAIFRLELKFIDFTGIKLTNFTKNIGQLYTNILVTSLLSRPKTALKENRDNIYQFFMWWILDGVDAPSRKDEFGLICQFFSLDLWNAS